MLAAVVANTVSTVAVDQDDVLVELFNEILKNGRKNAEKQFSTPSSIALPPEVRSTTVDEARARAKDVIRILTVHLMQGGVHAQAGPESQSAVDTCSGRWYCRIDIA